jgi:hypothetical protein
MKFLQPEEKQERNPYANAKNQQTCVDTMCLQRRPRYSPHRLAFPRDCRTQSMENLPGPVIARPKKMTKYNTARTGSSSSRLLTQRVLPWRFRRTPVVLRELLPQDLKLEMDQLTREEAVGAARFLASVVGQAHASQMPVKIRRKWLSDLKRNRAQKA